MSLHLTQPAFPDPHVAHELLPGSTPEGRSRLQHSISTQDLQGPLPAANSAFLSPPELAALKRRPSVSGLNVSRHSRTVSPEDRAAINKWLRSDGESLQSNRWAVKLVESFHQRGLKESSPFKIDYDPARIIPGNEDWVGDELTISRRPEFMLYNISVQEAFRLLRLYMEAVTIR